MKYIVYIFSFIIFLSCLDSKKSNSESNNDKLLVFDLDKAPIKDSIYASSFISSVTPIVLETIDNNLIGFLSAMQVTDSCICILDDGPDSSGCLFVFNKQGKFLREIGKKGQGPGEYIGIHDFTIDEKNDQIFLVDDDSEKIRVYQFSTGKFLRNIDFKDDNVVYRHIQYNNNKLFVDFTYYGKTKAGPMVYVLDETTGDIESKCLDVDTYNHGWLKPFFKGESFFYCKNSDKPKYTQYFMDTIMAVNKDKLEPYIVIKSKDWVTDQDVRSRKNTTPDAEQDAYFKIHESPIAFNIQNYVESERYIYFFYTKQQKDIIVLYDKKNKTLIRGKCLVNDLVYNEGYGRIYVVGCGDENGMYGYIHSASMPDFYRFMQDPLIPIKPEYRKFFENRITPESNPVLFYYEYKK